MNYSNYLTQYPDNKGEFDGYGGACVFRTNVTTHSVSS